MLANIVVASFVAFREVTQANTTEFAATLESARGPHVHVVFHSQEHGDLRTSLFMASQNFSDSHDFEHGQTVFFRVENREVAHLAEMSFIPIVSLRTQEAEIVSLSSFNADRAIVRIGLTLNGVFWFSIFLALTIFFALRRKRALAPQYHPTPNNIATGTKNKKEAGHVINMFRRAKFLYIGLIVLAALVLITLVLTTEAVHPLLAFFVWLVLVFVSAIIAERYANKLNNEILDMLSQKCDPHGFIEKYVEILCRRIGNSRTYVLLNLSSGYLSSGDMLKAKRILDSVENFTNSRAGTLNKTCYYNNLCFYYLNIDDIANAEIMLNNMLEVLKNEKFPKQQYDGLYNLYVNKQFAINMAKGNYSGAEEWFFISFNREKSLLDKVIAQYQLGRIYLHFERFEEAEKAFNYVIDNGNTTHYVAKSHEFLNQCTEKR